MAHPDRGFPDDSGPALRARLSDATGPELQVVRTEIAFARLSEYGNDAVAGGPGLTEAAELAELALAAPSCPPGLAAEAMLAAGLARYFRFAENQDRADLDLAVEHLRALLDPARIPETDPGLRQDGLAALAEALETRALGLADDAASRQQDLSEAIQLQTVLCDELTEAGEPDADALLALGRLHYHRHDQGTLGGTGRCHEADLDRAIACLRRSRAGTPANSSLAVQVNLYLALALSKRVMLGTARPAEVEEALAELAAVRASLPPGDIQRAVADLHEGITLGTRYLAYAGRSGDRQSGLDALRRALRHPELAAEPALADLARMWLGQLLMTPLPPGLPGTPGPGGAPGPAAGGGVPGLAGQVTQLVTTPEFQADAAEVVRELSQVSRPALRDPPAAAAVAALLGAALMALGVPGMTAADRDRVIAHFAEAATILPDNAPGAAQFAALHAWLLAERAGQPGNGAEIEGALRELERVRPRLDAVDPLLRPVVLHHLGLLLGRRGLRRLTPADLAGGIQALTEALALMDADHPLRPETLRLLGAALISGAQFDSSGAQADRAIEVLEHGLRPPAADPVKQAIHLCCYGQALHARARRGDPTAAGFAPAVAAIQEGERLLPDRDPRRGFLLLTVASMLADQFDYVGNLESLGAADHYLSDDNLAQAGSALDSLPDYDPEGVSRYAVRALRGQVRLQLGQRRQDRSLLAAALADLEFALGVLPGEHPMRPRMASEVSTTRLALAVLDGDDAALGRIVGEITQADLPVAPGHVDQVPLAGRAAMLLLCQAVDRRDIDQVNRAVAQMSQAAAMTGPAGAERARLNWGAGLAFRLRHDVTRSRADIEAAVTKLEEARCDLDIGPGHPAAAHILAELAQAYRVRGDPARGDQRRAVRTGLESLREQAGEVLLQSIPARALTMARMAAADAAEICAWCRAGGALDQAVEALELSRGLVLQAASSAAGLPDLLREAGQAGLAGQWEGAGHAEGPLPPWDQVTDGDRHAIRVGLMASLAAPSDLRPRVLRALADAGLDRALLSPPGAAETAALLRASGIDLAAYLVPADEHGAGYAIVVRPDGTVQDLPLPQLATHPGSPAHVCAMAQRDVHDADGAQAWEHWAQSLARLADWAWAVVVEPLLVPLLLARATAGAAEPPRLLLIPFGLLGMVPWHAASYTDSAGRRRYACEHAVFSYAASIRQLTDATRRPSLPPRAGHVLVADPGQGFWEAEEVEALQAAFYPDASVLSGDPPRATPARVLGALPGRAGATGAALIHLACHARTAPSPEHSGLQLCGDQEPPAAQPLEVDRILRQGAGRPPPRPAAWSSWPPATATWRSATTTRRSPWRRRS